MNNRIPIVIPDIEFSDVMNDFERIITTGILTSGPFVVDFERAVAEWVGVEHAIATTSATTAIHLALVGLGVGEGHEVLVPDFTFPATINAVLQTRATPVLVDSRAEGFDMDPASAAGLVSERTKVVLPIDPFGQPADHVALESIATEVGAALVVDAACSLGASRGGAQCGSQGTAGCFSFHPRKVVTCGEGGMVTTDDPVLAGRLRLLRDHGSTRRVGAGLEFTEPGFNYRLSEIPAVLGLSQVRRLDRILEDRRRTAERYDLALSGCDGVTVLHPTPGVEWSYQSYVIVLDGGIDRNRVIELMAEASIETTIGTYACHQHPAYEPWSAGTTFPNSAQHAERALTLPLVPRMEEHQVERVVESLDTAIYQV